MNSKLVSKYNPIYINCVKLLSSRREFSSKNITISVFGYEISDGIIGAQFIVSSNSMRCDLSTFNFNQFHCIFTVSSKLPFSFINIVYKILQ